MAWDATTPEGIMHLQRGLNYAIWYNARNHIPVTGVMDQNTIRSINEFQRVFDMAVTGIVTPRLQTNLENEMIRKNITEW
jgi:hypothetical protein